MWVVEKATQTINYSLKLGICGFLFTLSLGCTIFDLCPEKKFAHYILSIPCWLKWTYTHTHTPINMNILWYVCHHHHEYANISTENVILLFRWTACVSCFLDGNGKFEWNNRNHQTHKANMQCIPMRGSCSSQCPKVMKVLWQNNIQNRTLFVRIANAILIHFWLKCACTHSHHHYQTTRTLSMVARRSVVWKFPFYLMTLNEYQITWMFPFHGMRSALYLYHAFARFPMPHSHTTMIRFKIIFLHLESCKHENVRHSCCKVPFH